MLETLYTETLNNALQNALVDSSQYIEIKFTQYIYKETNLEDVCKIANTTCNASTWKVV